MGVSNKRKESKTLAGLLARAITKKKDRPFTTRELMHELPEASRAGLDMALSRLVGTGQVRRLMRGVFDVPQHHPDLGELPADPVDVAYAVARAEGAQIVPSGALAANYLGISQQVPSRYLFRTSGPSKHIRLDNAIVELRHSGPGRLRTSDPNAATIIEALRTCGRNGVSPDTIATIRERISDKDRPAITKSIPNAPVWMQPHLRDLVKS